MSIMHVLINSLTESARADFCTLKIKILTFHYKKAKEINQTSQTDDIHLKSEFSSQANTSDHNGIKDTQHCSSPVHL